MKTKKKVEEQKTERKYVNEVRLVGYLGDQPKRYENRVVMSLATVTSSKRGEQWDRHTDWHRIVAWGDQAEIAEIFGKGDHIEVTGYLHSSQRPREVKTVDGKSATVETLNWEIRARSVRLLDKAKPKTEPVAA